MHVGERTMFMHATSQAADTTRAVRSLLTATAKELEARPRLDPRRVERFVIVHGDVDLDDRLVDHFATMQPPVHVVTSPAFVAMAAAWKRATPAVPSRAANRGDAADASGAATSLAALTDAAEQAALVFDGTVVGVSKQLFAVLARSLSSSNKASHKWRGKTLTEDSGQKTAVRFRDGIIVNWSLDQQRWVPVMPIGTDDELLPLSSIGDAIASGLNLDDAVQEQIDERHTGNHHRNHHVRVPTGPDGAVRG